MRIKAIHQASFACSSGSGVTNSMFYVRYLLRQLGFQSEIFSATIPIDLVKEVLPVSMLKDHAETLLFYHHCLGYDETEWLFALNMPKVMVYHNITPPHLLPPEGDLRRCALLGHEQLRAWNRHFLGAIGDSPFNTNDLIANAYLNTVTIPMLVDFDKLSTIDADVGHWTNLYDAYNILFVGRICENKRQLELVEAIHHLKHMTSAPIRLVLVGEVTSGQYAETIRIRIAECGLQDQVLLVGKVSDERLAGLYKSVDAFVCLSEHEGFGMPLIEAMHFGLPVIARNSSAIADTLGQGGILLNAEISARDCAAAILTLMQEPGLKRHLIVKQQAHLNRFAKYRILSQLSEYLQQLQVSIPNRPIENATEQLVEGWQIEGPFDSSYSLAIVNRELARALHRRGTNIALRSREGGGDFNPSPTFLEANPDCRALFEKSRQNNVPFVSLRFCYPPNVDDMQATIRMVHSYGWEETGFPKDFVEMFNRRLDVVTVLSREVGKVLRDNGVRIPIAVTGAGVDHLLNVAPQNIDDAICRDWRGFRFLHISSCFPRKGIDVLLKAYEEAFSIADDTTLVIKTFRNPHHEVKKLVEEIRQANPNYPHVVVIEDDWSQEQLVGLYRQCHVFVAPSRGEGFGLPLAEAMLFDLPVITTSWGGQTDFCNNSTAWCCDYRFAKAATHLGQTHSLWAEPDQHHLSQLMREVVSIDSDVRIAKTQLAHERILNEFTWDKTAQKIQEVVNALKELPILRVEPKIGWISTWNARCGIANYSHFLTQMIPNQRLTILANHIPERMALDAQNVVRCWNAESGEDFSCGLETIIEQKISAVVIQYNFGFCSTANLANFIRKLKSLKIAVYIFFHSTSDVLIEKKLVTLSHIKSELAEADRLFVHSVEDMNRLKSWDLVANTVYFPHGIATPQKNYLPKLSQYLNKTVIASYGFLLPHKGIRALIEAFALLDSQPHNLHLLLVNALYPASVSHDEERVCRQRIEELGLVNKVTFITDFLSDNETQQILSNADMVVFPYQQTQESSSAAVRVGLSTGRPVLVTPLPIFDDVEEAVFKLPGTSPELIADGIRSMLDNPQHAEIKQAEIAQWFEARHWPTLSLRLLNIIDGLANPLGNHVRNM